MAMGLAERNNSATSLVVWQALGQGHCLPLGPGKTVAAGLAHTVPPKRRTVAAGLAHTASSQQRNSNTQADNRVGLHIA